MKDNILEIDDNLNIIICTREALELWVTSIIQHYKVVMIEWNIYIINDVNEIFKITENWKNK